MLIKNRKFKIAAVFLVFGILTNQLTSFLIEKVYGTNLPVLGDIILDNIPYLKIAWLYDLLAIFPIVLFAIYAYKKDFNKIPYFFLIFAISQFIRGIFIIMTPFGSPNNNLPGIFEGSAFRNGVYPSGHTGTSFLAFLLSKGIWKKIFLMLSISIMVTLLLGRGHYSIDIFSAIIFSYAISCFGKRYLEKRFTIEKDGKFDRPKFPLQP